MITRSIEDQVRFLLDGHDRYIAASGDNPPEQLVNRRTATTLAEIRKAMETE